MQTRHQAGISCESHQGAHVRVQYMLLACQVGLTSCTLLALWLSLLGRSNIAMHVVFSQDAAATWGYEWLVLSITLVVLMACARLSSQDNVTALVLRFSDRPLPSPASNSVLSRLRAAGGGGGGSGSAAPPPTPA